MGLTAHKFLPHFPPPAPNFLRPASTSPSPCFKALYQCLLYFLLPLSFTSSSSPAAVGFRAVVTCGDCNCCNSWRGQHDPALYLPLHYSLLAPTLPWQHQVTFNTFSTLTLTARDPAPFNSRFGFLSVSGSQYFHSITRARDTLIIVGGPAGLN